MPKTNIAEKVANRIAQDSGAALDKSYNEMFGLPSVTEEVVLLPIRNLRHYEKDPFKDRLGDEMEKLAASIRENGLQYPIIVRPIKQAGQYEILAGRRRVNAVKANGEKEIKAIIRDVDDNESAMIVTETNLRSREKLFHSEKAYAYKLQLEAIKRQGKRTDLANGTSTQIAWKSESAQIIADKNDVSKDEIRRYIRLTCLIPQLLDLVDADKIPFVAGYNLSYLDEAAQTLVHAFFFDAEYGVKLDIKMAEAIKAAFKANNSLSDEMIEALCQERHDNGKPRNFSINRKKLQPYLGSLPDDDELERLFLEFIASRFGAISA